MPKNTEAAKLHEAVGKIVLDGVANLSTDSARQEFAALLLESAKKLVAAANGEPPPPRPQPADVREALSIADEIQSLADEVEWPDAPDVAEKAGRIAATVERLNEVTDGQMDALRNMLRGMEAWVRD